MDNLKASIGKAFTTLGTAVIPVLNKLFDGIKQAIPVLRDTFAPVFEALKELWQDLQPTLADLGRYVGQRPAAGVAINLAVHIADTDTRPENVYFH